MRQLEQKIGAVTRKLARKLATGAEVELKVDAELSLRGGGNHWYQKWWVYAGGIVVLGAVGGGIYLATREPPDSVPVGGSF